MSATPPWTVEDWGLERDLAKIDQQWGALRELLEDEGLFTLRAPVVSGWSCGEHAGHVVLAAGSIASAIERNLADPARDVDRARAEMTAAILEQGRIPRGAAESPPQVDPSGRAPGELLALLSSAETSWRAIEEKADSLHACPARRFHFALGYLTSVEWVRFCAVHTAHHLGVVRDICASSPESAEG